MFLNARSRALTTNTRRVGKEKGRKKGNGVEECKANTRTCTATACLAKGDDDDEDEDEDEDDEDVDRAHQCRGN